MVPSKAAHEGLCSHPGVSFKVMGDDERLAEATALDEKRETWLKEIEADLEEKFRLRESTDKVQSAQHQEDQYNQEMAPLERQSVEHLEGLLSQDHRPPFKHQSTDGGYLVNFPRSEDSMSSKQSRDKTRSGAGKTPGSMSTKVTG